MGEYKTDLQIAKEAVKKNIDEIAAKLGIGGDDLKHYGKYIAKVSSKLYNIGGKNGKLILVTAITPTPSGEGKTTMSIGVADSLSAAGEKVCLALREPSLGPVFGMKGGAAGGGYAQVLPMEEINLHFTGDIHAITAANNLLCAMIDNHIYQGNQLNIDPRTITFKRCMDMNDRQLRYIIGGLSGAVNGVPREDGFDITAASEVMAAFCLSGSIDDLKARLAKIQIGKTYDRKPVFALDIGAQGAMATLLKDALDPNLIQTIEGTPCLMHGGPFANIAHGCNSVIATKTALKFADYVVTEAGFGADLGAEKFLDIKCRAANIWPSAVVLVVTLKALKCHGGLTKEEWSKPNAQALEAGLANMEKHISNLKNVYGVNVVVAINRFVTDTPEEMELIKESAAKFGVEAVSCEMWEKGSAGGKEIAQAVLKACEGERTPQFCYDLNASLQSKMESIVKRIYGGGRLILTDDAKKQIEYLESCGYGSYPVCIAKTQYSLTDDPKSIGCPKDFDFTVREVKVSGGAGFVVALAGKMMTMPGLPKVPSALSIDVDINGNVKGLF